MSRRFLFLSATVLAITLGASAVIYHRQRLEHDRLAAQLTAIRAHLSAADHLRVENVRMAELVDLNRRDRRQAAAELHADLERARQDVAELEHKAVNDRKTMREQEHDTIAALQMNHDLTKGPMLIENCADVGRASPEAALQTLIWAAAHGRDDAVRNAVTFDGAAHILAEAAIATLPESARSKYPQPESLAALFAAQVVNDLTGIRIVDRTVLGNEATLKIAGLQKQLGDIVLRQTPDGWQAVLSPPDFDRIRRLLLTPKK